jgi:hypothetical protein
MWKEEPAAKLDLDSEAVAFSLKKTHQNNSSSSRSSAGIYTGKNSDLHVAEI